MAKTRGSATTSVPVPTLAQPRRSTRNGRGTGGRDVQLDQLGDILVAPTRQQKRRFAPDDVDSLPVNPCAPVPKKRRTRKKKTPDIPFPEVAPHWEPGSQPQTPTRSLTQPPTHAPTQPLPYSPAQSFSRSPAQSFLGSPPRPVSQSPPAVQSLSQSPVQSSSQSPVQPVVSSRFGFFPPPLSQHPPNTLSPPPIRSSSEHLSSDINIPLPSPQEVDPESGSDEGETDEEEAEIDETSDGEDDRRAHELLQAAPFQIEPTRGNSPIVLPHDNHDFADLSLNESVLQQHHSRNRVPKTPTPLPPQRSSATPPPRRSSSPSVTPPQRSSVTPPAAPRPAPERRATLDTYPSLWREVINNAKKTFRVYLAGTNGFPSPPEAVQEARECLEDALAVHHEEGKLVEATHNISKDMAMLVYAESWNFRSQLKADIRVQVRNLKTLFPDRFAGSAEEYQSHIRTVISAWVNNGSYLHGTIVGSDDQIHFAHPIIESTCKAFYFDKWANISTLDQETFRGAVPKPLLALVGAIYRNVLDEWASGVPKTVKLECDDYGLVYDAILNGLEAVEKDGVDGPLLRQRLASWAGFGMSMNAGITVPRISTAIHLKLSST